MSANPLIEEKSGAPPTVVALDVSVGSLVHEAHEGGIAAFEARGAQAGLGAKDLEAILTYCAEHRCDAVGITCGGCQRHVKAQGYDSVDKFIAAHHEISFTEGATKISGQGNRRATYKNIDEMMWSWSGEAYWFWARRVLRKLRYGIRKASALTDTGPTEVVAPSILLMAPQIADNIGMAARAMGNFGLDDLRVIEPRDGWPSEKARAVASGAAAIIDSAGLHATLGDAIGDLNWVCATTARQRDMRKPVLTPSQVAAEMHRRTAEGQRCGILFGRERNGLQSDEIADCDAMVMIPVKSDFASLNLAQAVLLLGYEWLKASNEASLGRVTTYESPLETGVYMNKDAPANKQELLGLYEHLEAELERLGFFNPSTRRHVVVRNVRNMLGRMNATGQEVKTLRGIVATLANGKGRRRKVTE
ncbi:MAG: tRNA/rRNA methyltransferase [Hyphomicrobiaceae bacterium]